MSHEPPLPYRCTVCDADWSYEAVRHIACCRACGGSLVRSDAATPAAAPSLAAPSPARRVKRRGGRPASPLPAR